MNYIELRISWSLIKRSSELAFTTSLSRIILRLFIIEKNPYRRGNIIVELPGLHRPEEDKEKSPRYRETCGNQYVYCTHNKRLIT